MKYLLDTNILIYYLSGKFHLDEKLNQIGFLHRAFSEISFAELIYGAEKSQHPERNLAIANQLIDRLIVLPIFESIPLYAKEKARLVKKGMPISDFDLLIGATAVQHGLVMVTHNIKEFERIEGIQLENWVQ